MTHKHMEATLLDWVRSVFKTHHDWIESVLGVPADRAITFCVRNNLHALVVPRVLPASRSLKRRSPRLHNWASGSKRWNFLGQRPL